jgi:hypothetical protein
VAFSFKSNPISHAPRGSIGAGEINVDQEDVFSGDVDMGGEDGGGIMKQTKAEERIVPKPIQDTQASTPL